MQKATAKTVAFFGRQGTIVLDSDVSFIQPTTADKEPKKKPQSDFFYSGDKLVFTFVFLNDFFLY